MKHLLTVAAACIGVALAVLLLSWTTTFSKINSGAYDFTLRIAGELKQAAPTLIVAIDEESLRSVGPWPWSRDKLAQLIDRIQEGTPSAIAIDILLDDKGSRASYDDVLAASLARTPKIVLAARIASEQGDNEWRKPNKKFFQPHVKLGHVHTEPDLDGIARHVWSAKQGGDLSVIPALALQALHVAGFNPEGPFEQHSAGGTVLLPQPMGIRFIGGRQSFPHVTASTVLAGKVDKSLFKDRIVLVGYTADGIEDQWFTPFSTREGQKMNGVEIHANALDTFWSGRAVTEASNLTVFLALLSSAVFLWWLQTNRRTEGFRFYLLAVALLPASVVLSWALMRYTNTWLPFPPLWGTIVLASFGLATLEIVRVNSDLDQKLIRLSVWDEMFRHSDYDWDARQSAERRRLLSAQYKNARWRLQAVDFFNEDLVRFLSFNNAILSSIDDVIMVADPSGRVAYQNPAAQKLDGYIAHPAQAAAYLSTLLDGRGFDGLATNATLVPTRDGKRHFNVAFSPISEMGVVISLHDTSAQYELDQAKNDMVSLVSHELRTPLTSIRGYSDMLLKYDLVAEKGKPFLGTIIEESQRLNGLIQSFLDVAYIESGRQKLALTEFDAVPVMKDMMDVLRPVAAAKQIRIDAPRESQSTRVRADRLLLVQALSNLMTNAIKYSPSGTTVSLSVSVGDGSVRFQVADQGFGIPPEDTGRVFEKFYRRGNKETRDQSGFGLGLAFVKEVAVKHGGDVQVESEVGKGSRFTLSIPN